jgi:hypothetical protein
MADNNGDAATAGLLAAVVSLRTTALRLFTSRPSGASPSSHAGAGLSLQEDLFPDETIAAAVARADAAFPSLPVASITQQPSANASASFLAEEVAAAQIDHTPALRRFAMCAAPASHEDAQAVVHALRNISSFMLKPTEVANAQNTRAEFASAVAAADDEGGGREIAAVQLAAFDVILQVGRGHLSFC